MSVTFNFSRVSFGDCPKRLFSLSHEERFVKFDEDWEREAALERKKEMK